MPIVSGILAVVLGLPIGIQNDTTVVLARHAVDLTGDGHDEVIEVIGSGGSIDSLGVQLTIRTGGDVLYTDTLKSLTRTVGFDAGRRVLSRDDHLKRFAGLQEFYFSADRFSTPRAFLEHLHRSTPRRIELIPHEIEGSLGRRLAPRTGERIWSEIMRDMVPVFTYAVGGDGILAVAWSSSERRFVQVWGCC